MPIVEQYVARMEAGFRCDRLEKGTVKTESAEEGRRKERKACKGERRKRYKLDRTRTRRTNWESAFATGDRASPASCAKIDTSICRGLKPFTKWTVITKEPISPSRGLSRMFADLSRLMSLAFLDSSRLTSLLSHCSLYRIAFRSSWV